jgi:hypothetical protein
MIYYKGDNLPPQTLYDLSNDGIMHVMDQHVPTARVDENDLLSGIWRSRYHYTSSSRPGEELTSEHQVRLHKQGKQLVLESIRDEKESSYLFVRLSLNEDNIATGSWEEATNPKGHYNGAVYYGAIQLSLDQSRSRMSGKWVGFGKNQEVNSGPWEFIKVESLAV